jgi:hypothetical protein
MTVGSAGTPVLSAAVEIAKKKITMKTTTST